MTSESSYFLPMENHYLPQQFYFLDTQSQKSSKKKKDAKKKEILIGPKNNNINFYRILNCHETNDTEILGLTTLMIKNIPMKFMQQDVLQLINPNFHGKYDYFYLPMDLKTQSSVGYAFINFIDPLFILDFYLTFNYIKWSNYMPNCNSGKLGEIVYANM